MDRHQLCPTSGRAGASDSTMQFLDIEGHRLGVIAGGEERAGPPVILLHGIAFSVHFWTANLPPCIRERYRWYAVTQPYHWPARFPEHEDRHIDADLFARLLSETLEKLVGDEPAILIGHSLGAFAAFNLAAQFPRQVCGIVSISGIASGHGQAIMGGIQRMARGGPIRRAIFRSLWRFAIASPGFFQWMLSQCAADPRRYRHSPQAAATQQAMLPDLQNQDPDALRRLMGRLYDVDMSPQLPSIQAPTLMIAGEDDPINKLARQQRIAAAIPHCELRIVPHCGHLFYAEQPQLVAEILDDWLRRHGGQ